MNEPMIELTSAIRPGDRWAVPQCVVLRRSGQAGEWATRIRNPDKRQEWSGHYFIADALRGGERGAYTRALRDYLRRCRHLGVAPSASEPATARESGNAVVMAAGLENPGQWETVVAVIARRVRV